MINFLASQKYLQKNFNNLKEYSKENDIYCPNMKNFFDDMSKRFKLKTLKKGDLMFHMGDEGDEMLIVLDGTIECAIPKQDQEKVKDLKKLDICWDKLVKKALKSEEHSIIGFGGEGIRGDDRDEILKIIKIMYPKSLWRELTKLRVIPEKLAMILTQKRDFPFIREEALLMLGFNQNYFSKPVKGKKNLMYLSEN